MLQIIFYSLIFLQLVVFSLFHVCYVLLTDIIVQTYYLLFFYLDTFFYQTILKPKIIETIFFKQSFIQSKQSLFKFLMNNK